MERLRARINAAKKALSAFGQLVHISIPNDIERDACIQRFEFTFEACWKAAKHYFYEIEGIDVGSPKSVFRSCREIQLLDLEETVLGLKMVDSRNLTVHTYNEEVAKEIYSRLNKYYDLMFEWIKRMESHLSRINGQ